MNANITQFPQRNADATSAAQFVADNLAAELARRRISGRKAATAMGLSVPYVARRISGETPLDINDLFAFSALLGIDPTVLLGTQKPHQSPDGVNVGPAGIEPTTSTVEYGHLAEVIQGPWAA